MLKEKSGTGRRKKSEKSWRALDKDFLEKKNHRTITLTMEKDDLSRKYF